MPSDNPGWSPAEKKLARIAYDAAVQVALAQVMTELKRRAEAAKEPMDMWEIERYLGAERRAIDEMFTYSYSKLLSVFAYAIHKGYMDESHIAGLADDKLSAIRRMLAWARE